MHSVSWIYSTMLNLWFKIYATAYSVAWSPQKCNYRLQRHGSHKLWQVCSVIICSANAFYFLRVLVLAILLSRLYMLVFCQCRHIHRICVDSVCSESFSPSCDSVIVTVVKDLLAPSPSWTARFHSWWQSNADTPGCTKYKCKQYCTTTTN